MSIWLWILLAVVVFLVVVAIYDLVQTRHAILRNFPVVGHLRYLLERVGPELRQYIVTNNDEERPFSRDQRRWVYATAKKENSYFGFGTDNDLDVDNYVIVRHSAFPLVAEDHAELGADVGVALVHGRDAGLVDQRVGHKLVVGFRGAFGVQEAEVVKESLGGQKIRPCVFQMPELKF